VKASFKKRNKNKIMSHRPETRWANHEQVEHCWKIVEGPNPYM